MTFAPARRRSIRTPRGFITAEEWEAMSAARRNRLLALGYMPPLAGGAPDDDDDDDDDDDADDDDDDADADADKDGDDDADDDDDDGDEDVATELRAKLRAANKKAAEAEAAKVKAEKALARKRKTRVEQDTEIVRERDEAVARAEKAESDLVTYKQERTALDIATKQKAKRPATVVKLIDLEPEDEEADIEDKVKKVLKENPEMKKSGGAQRDDVDGDNGSKPKRRRRTTTDDDVTPGPGRLRLAYGADD